MRLGNIVGRERHGHLVRMPGRLLVHAVNQVHGALGIMTLEFRLNPYGEEFRSQIALFDLVQINVALGYRRVLADIEVFIQETLWRVSVRINDQGGLMDCRAGSALGRVAGAALAVFLCGAGCCASAKLESRRKQTREPF